MNKITLISSYRDHGTEAGCDEAGRGCLAGPVCAAAVILPQNFYHPLLNDSKKINENNRYLLRDYIEKEAIDFAVTFVDNNRIDVINILNASIEGMHLSLKKLKQKPDLILVDGNRFKPFENTEHVCIVEGDAKYMSIAAASILAKTYRDDFMNKIHTEFPVYEWNKNKGYPTAAHRKAIEKNGITCYHRKTFRLIDSQLSLNF